MVEFLKGTRGDQLVSTNVTANILDILMEHQHQFISGEQLSEHLQISRTAIWKHMTKLREQGYEIEASKKLGYKLVFSPDRIDVAKLEALELENIKLSVQYIDKVESTQFEAKRLAEAGAPQGTIVIAEQQLNGKGRLGRRWTSPYGKGIWMSIILRPDIPLHIAPQFTIMLGDVVAESLSKIISKYNTSNNDIMTAIKWPNDVLMNRKKVSGILLESYAEEQRVKYIIAGIGINVNVAEDDFPEQLSTPATSLRIEAGVVVKRTDVLTELFSQLDQSINFYKLDLFEDIRAQWTKHAFQTLGVLTKIKSGDKVFEAFPLSIDEHCALTIRHLDGTEERIISADIGEINYEVSDEAFFKPE